MLFRSEKVPEGEEDEQVENEQNNDQEQAEEYINQRYENYSNMYNGVNEILKRNKENQLQINQNNLLEDDPETREMLLKQQKQIEKIMLDYQKETKLKAYQREKVEKAKELNLRHSLKKYDIKSKKMEEEMRTQQKALNLKRDTQQILLCQKLYKLASQLEKNKIIEDRRVYLEERNVKNKQKRQILSSIENFYSDQIKLLIDAINQEKIEKQIAQYAQTTALSSLEKEIKEMKEKEMERYTSLLKQEEDKYNLMMEDSSKMEEDLIKLYKKLYFQLFTKYILKIYYYVKGIVFNNTF